MTKFQKQMLTIAAAGALTAVTALPAMALENEFNGTFTVKTFLSNYDNGQTGLNTQVSPAYGFGSATQQYKNMAHAKASNYTDQRLRINYTAKASDDLKLVTQMEMNTRWGNANVIGQNNGAGMGGGVDTDALNVALRYAYVDFNIGKSLNVKAGQQPFKDQLKGLYVDADLPALQVAYKSGNYKLNLAYSRFNDDDATNYGSQSADLFAVENTYSFSKDTKVSLVYYLNTDNVNHENAPGVLVSRQKKINTFGVSGETQFGALNVSGFAAMQAGYQKNAGTMLSATSGRTINYHGWAANTAAKMKVGSGLAKMGFLFTSGNGGSDASHDAHNNAWQTLSNSAATSTANGVAQNSYNESGMMLLARNTSMGGTNTDNYFRKPVSNIALLTMGYDANLTDKLYMNGNVGFAWAPSSESEFHMDNATAIKSAWGVAENNASDFMGTEINLETGYKLYKNLTIKAQAAYVILGGYYKDSAAVRTAAGFPTVAATPDNPYTMRLAASFSF